MELHTIDFFSANKEHPVAHCQYDPEQNWYPALVRINKSIDNEYDTPIVKFYMSLPDLIAFKNSFLSSFERAMKEAGYGK